MTLQSVYGSFLFTWSVLWSEYQDTNTLKHSHDQVHFPKLCCFSFKYYAIVNSRRPNSNKQTNGLVSVQSCSVQTKLSWLRLLIDSWLQCSQYIRQTEIIWMEYRLHSCKVPLFVRVANNVCSRVKFKLWLIWPCIKILIKAHSLCFQPVVYSVKSVSFFHHFIFFFWRGEGVPLPAKKDEISEIGYDKN
jgi:hypothetical protein